MCKNVPCNTYKARSAELQIQTYLDQVPQPIKLNLGGNYMIQKKLQIVDFHPKWKKWQLKIWILKERKYSIKDKQPQIPGDMGVTSTVAILACLAEINSRIETKTKAIIIVMVIIIIIGQKASHYLVRFPNKLAGTWWSWLHITQYIINTIL